MKARTGRLRAARRQELRDIARRAEKAGSPEERKMYSEYGRLVGRYYKTGQIPSDDEMRAAGFVTQEEFQASQTPPPNENVPALE